jgi:hypothetical protein
VVSISAKGQPSKRETSLSLGVLMVLAGIAVGVFLKQFRYNPAIFVGVPPQAGSAGTFAVDLSGDMLADLAEGMAPLTPLERFGPQNLSDKINGKAELYLAANVLGLLCQRFAETRDPSSWMEAFVYDMGTLQRAFAVYSIQRRADAKNVNVTQFAYRTENALFFAHGRYYVELIAAVITEKMAQAMQLFAQNFIKKTGLSSARIDELILFPQQGLDEDSITLLISDAFGFDRFDNVFMANYILGNTELRAFLSSRKDSLEASELVAAYHDFLKANGGVDAKSDMKIPGVKLVNIFDTYELIFSHGKFLAGVHEAEEREKAEKLAVALMQKLSGAAR